MLTMSCTTLVQFLLTIYVPYNMLSLFTIQEQSTPLHFAAYGGHQSVVEQLIKCEVDVNAFNVVTKKLAALHQCIYLHMQLSPQMYYFTVQDKFTPLHIAAQEGHYSIVECLITSGTDVNIVSNVRKLLLLMLHLVLDIMIQLFIDYFGEISHTYICVYFAVINYRD